MWIIHAPAQTPLPGQAPRHGRGYSKEVPGPDRQRERKALPVAGSEMVVWRDGEMEKIRAGWDFLALRFPVKNCECAFVGLIHEIIHGIFLL